MPLGRGTGRGAFVAMVLAAGALLAPVAGANEVSSAELAALADAARSGDGAARGELDAVTSVDGRPASPAAALSGATGADLEARLRELGESAEASGAAQPGRPDREVREVGEGSGGIDAPALSIGAPGLLQVLVVAAILVAALLIFRAIGRRRVLDVARSAAAKGARDGGESAADLERRAAAAEAAGDYASAIGLRFDAGLRRLNEAGALRLRPSLTPAAAARETGSPTLRELATSYSRVLYGGAAAGPGEAAASRDGWPSVLREAGAGGRAR